MHPICIVCCLAVLLPVGDSVLPELPPELRDDPYIKELLKISYQWNIGEIEFPAHKMLGAQFKDEIDRRVNWRANGYETRGWADGKLRQFAALAETANHPKLKLDQHAIVTLTLAFSINLPFVRERFKPESLKKELALPTYLVFFGAQERALKAKHNFITSEDISRTIFSWWTTVWPFCAPPVKKSGSEYEFLGTP